MAPKKASEPAAGQRSIQSFFAAKPKPVAPQVPLPCAEDAQPKAEELPAAPAPVPAPICKPDLEPTTVTKEEGSRDLLGSRVRVYWPAEDAWFKGTLSKYSSDTKKHYVRYDDGDSEWVDLTTEKYEILPGEAAAPKKKASTHKSKAKGGSKAASRKRPAAAVISSDSEGDEDGDGAAPSGSEYEASDASSSDAESLVSENDSEEDVSDEEDSEDEKPARKAKKAAPAAKPSKAKAPATTPAVVNPAGKAPNSSHRTPGVALNNGVSITPDSGNGVGAGGVTPAVPRPSAAHAPASATAMRTALDDAASPSDALNAAATANDASRFMGRDAARFPFIQPDKIRDAGRRRPDEPGYDPTTLYIPPDWFKANKVSEGQRQWWEFKAAHWDSVLLFKMGKFYEMFEMDAHVGAECLGLSYMKGDQPHAGFPEAAYSQMAERLARAGHRVVVIEQTETPDMLAARNEERKRMGLKKDNVVRREKVAVLSRGTLTDAEMMGAVPDAQYLMAVAELPLPEEADAMETDAQRAGSGDDGREAAPSRDKVWIGAVAVDVATGQLLIGQWRDDELRSQLRAALTALQPVELVLPRGELSGPTRKVVLGVLRSPLVNELPVGAGDKCFWPGDHTWEELREGEYFATCGGTMPAVLAAMARDTSAHAAAGCALGGCISFLRSALLDKRVLGAGRVEDMAAAVGVGAPTARAERDVPAHMTLDGPALENLEILENSEGGTAGTLLAALDHCTTPFGRRRLRQWLCRPLCRVADIVARQDAVADLMGPAEDAAGAARKALAGLADLERSLARLAATGAGLGSARDSPKVILYEDVSKKRVHAFLGALQALEKVQEAAAAFEGCGASAPLLLNLVTPGRGSFPDMRAALAELRTAADWGEAEATGKVVPAAGVDSDFDAAVAAVEAAEAGLKDYLEEVRGELGASAKEVRYVSLNKESHVIEVPEDMAVPRTWEGMQGKKGIKRYTNAALKDLVAAREAALDAKDKAQSGILQGILRQFAERQALWAAAVDAVAQLDALMSLAVAASCASGPMTRPKLLPWTASDSPNGSCPVFCAKGLCHPAGIGGSGGTFVPNDVILGGDTAPFVVLTGPNMGGKSTLMRQVCLAAVAAQIGAWLPAEGVAMTPADAVFVRMGARDRIMLGQSTFFVELSETAAALARATPHSLVALDELGRGTSTTDGAAIASAVLNHLAAKVRCRGVFATHYHHIADAHAEDPAVAIKHMACAVTPAAEAGGVDEVTFLYRLSAGACPKSYGVNVARLAGLPEAVVRRAAVVSEQSEARGEGKQGRELGEPMAVDCDGGEGEEARLEKLREKVLQAGKPGAGVEALREAWTEARRALGLSA